MGLGKWYIGMGGSGEGVHKVWVGLGMVLRWAVVISFLWVQAILRGLMSQLLMISRRKITKDTEKESEKVPVDEPEKKESGESFVAPADEEGEVGAGEEEVNICV